MLSDKMERFLKSIGISDLESYDLDFEMLGKNRFDPSQYDMVILKDTPWSYELLSDFMNHLPNISYKYTLRFSYQIRANADDILKLFNEWYIGTYKFISPINIAVSESGDSLEVTYLGDKEEEDYGPVIKDFKKLLEFISYDIEINETLVEVEENNYTEEEKEEARENAEQVASENISKNVESVSFEGALDSEESKSDDDSEGLTDYEASFLKEWKNNYKEMMRERERARLNRKGHYIPFDFIDELDTNSENVDINGKVYSTLIKENPSGNDSLTVGIYDPHGGAISARFTVNDTTLTNEKAKQIKNGTNVRIRGAVYYNSYSKDLTIRGHYIDILPPDIIKHEKAETPRVELHLHTKMSAMDGVTSIDDYCAYAKALGHKAIAVTDHGVVQSFPAAYKAAKDYNMKMIYGCEFYMMDERQVYVYNPREAQLRDATYVVLDLETSGLSITRNNIIEFGAVRVEHGTVVAHKDILINPGYQIDDKIVNLTHITNAMLMGKPKLKEVIPEILDFMKDAILVTHNASFDLDFLNAELQRNDYPKLNNIVIDTLTLARYFFPQNRSHRLTDVCKRMDIYFDNSSAHRADYDAERLNEVWQNMLAMFTKGNKDFSVSDLEKLETPEEAFKHIRPRDICVLAKNKAGLKDLYSLVSDAHIKYFSEYPRIPRHELEAHRENLLFGSACCNGEVFETARNKGAEDLKKVMKFYDYIEIQPKDCYSHLINLHELKQSELDSILQLIVDTASELHIPVVATGDVHYDIPEHKVFRDIYISGEPNEKSHTKTKRHPLNPFDRKLYPYYENPNQGYLSTDEMLNEFSWLGEEKAYEVVVTNSNLIADQIDDAMVPVPNDKLYTPKIEDISSLMDAEPEYTSKDDNIIREICYKKAYEIYGNPLPQVIETRLSKELNGIISHGYSVIYYIAHRIVKKSNEDGYVIGSRGSVGSSVAAYFAGITEVNPLEPHYVCPKCHHLEWTLAQFPDCRSGYDLPDKKCPECGCEMIHDGQNIPFETFLGFEAEKIPDIDLNCASEYQKTAHEYVRQLLGEQNVFRAGTIATVADKTAYAKARDYITWLGQDPDTYSRNKLNYLASGCVDVKRTTGQHPAGLIVIPKEYSVYDFTPIQYPADEKDSDLMTTHFDYHSIHDTVLKIDLLGHDDPTALKMMCDSTGVDINSIPFNDPKVLSLFSSYNELNLSHNFLNQTNGALGLPEFGTPFVRGILDATKPKSFSDLVIISGISHGTGVWNGNADELIAEGTASLREVIGCRDDIMSYLISKGLSSSVAFSIMEDVRRGKGIKDEYRKAMEANNIPEYYINSCNKIKYLFPKGHATAYVMMAVRVAYFKVYYPLHYYATFFSVRSKEWDIETMVEGEEATMRRIRELQDKSKSSNEDVTKKEGDILITLQLAMEMFERGYSFSNIDLYKSDASNFVIDEENNKLIPPFICLEGVGLNVAQSVVESRKDGEFKSKEDLAERTSLSSTNIKKLDELGVISFLPDSNKSQQLSLFGDDDFF
ncbi:MAG: PolC-type DNA polymerase III [Coprobacillus sp.]|nr:PolC-type DNA polymerase III [Coprobacillus sp.]